MHRSARALLVSTLLLSAAVPAMADEITDQLDQARKLYEDQDIAGAIEELEFVMQALKGRVAESYLAAFPEPPAGWTAEKAEQADASAAAFLGGGTMLNRVYTQSGGEGRIEAQLMAGGGFLSGLAGMMMNPQMLAAQPNAKRVRVGRENGVLIYDPAERTGQLVLDIGGKVTLMLDGRNLASGDQLQTLANGWNIARIKEIAGL